MKLDILAIGVHPDDVELGCGGTLLKHIALGKKVGILDLTRGELGTRGSAELRDIESLDSAKIMGAAVRENLAMADGFFVYSRENLIKIIRIIRKYQPEIVLANPIEEDRHPDHARAGKLISDACFYAGLLKIPTFLEDGTPQKQWRPKAIYHYMGDRYVAPDFCVDISDYIDKKIELVLAFKSQFFNPEYQKEELQTPISDKKFMDYLKSKAAVFGRPIGAKYAEGFCTPNAINVKNLFDVL